MGSNFTRKMVLGMVFILTIGLLWVFPDKTSFSENNDACVRCHTDAKTIDTITSRLERQKEAAASG